jgi:uncharacterized membrane protein YeaQ/YmgE (transglycosylase-associated protein family)
MIDKKVYVEEVPFMLGYLLIGASIGAVVGYIVPPGSLFWFTMGAVGAYVTHRYIDHRWY